MSVKPIQWRDEKLYKVCPKDYGGLSQRFLGVTIHAITRGIGIAVVLVFILASPGMFNSIRDWPPWVGVCAIGCAIADRSSYIVKLRFGRIGWFAIQEEERTASNAQRYCQSRKALIGHCLDGHMACRYGVNIDRFSSRRVAPIMRRLKRGSTTGSLSTTRVCCALPRPPSARLTIPSEHPAVWSIPAHSLRRTSPLSDCRELP